MRELARLLPALVSALLLTVPASAQLEPDPPIPVLAYYYIWFNPTSWNRAKSDFPLLGRYSSDEERVMRRHVEWAKQAGIDGFVVSWKSTDTLDPRLEQLIGIANEEDFDLAIIYQGLDFARQPLPAQRIRRDLQRFVKRYAHEPAFDLFGKPLVIWSGTWEFSVEDVASVTEGLRDDLLILASERRPSDYGRLAGLVDGDAYYWSSVNPETFPGYEEKLAAMAAAVHGHGGLWIAPAAPGFDARLLGGTTVVPRRDGETLRRQMDAAMGSSPDAVGIISWNEFSENTHIEPSQKFGGRYLEVVADVLDAAAPEIRDFDSSAPQGGGGSPLRIALIGGVVILTVVALSAIVRRDRQGTPRTTERG